MPLIPLVVVADEGYLFDELTNHGGTRAEINTVMTVNRDYTARADQVMPFALDSWSPDLALLSDHYAVRARYEHR
jgi:hypothetical protein